MGTVTYCTENTTIVGNVGDDAPYAEQGLTALFLP